MCKENVFKTELSENVWFPCSFLLKHRSRMPSDCSAVLNSSYGKHLLRFKSENVDFEVLERSVGVVCVVAEMASWKRRARGIFLHVGDTFSNDDDDDLKRGTFHKPSRLCRILYGQFPLRIYFSTDCFNEWKQKGLKSLKLSKVISSTLIWRNHLS